MSVEPGTVTQAAPLLVLLDGSETAVPALRLASYAPVLSDRVIVDRLGSQAVVLGTTGTPAGPVSGQRYTAYGSTVGTPTGAGNINLPYGVTFTEALYPVCTSGSGAIVMVGSAASTSTGTATLYDVNGVLITTGSRRVNWTVTGTIA